MEDTLTVAQIEAYWLNHLVDINYPPGRVVRGTVSKVDVREWVSNGEHFQYIQLTVNKKKYDAKCATRAG